MKTPSPLRPFGLTALLSLSTLSVFAAPYASDGFDYTLGAAAAGQSGGSGFGSAWAFAGTGVGTTATIVAGLSLDGLASSGNAVEISANYNADTVTGTLGRQFGSDVPGNSDLWGSFLIRQTAQSAPNGYYGEFAVSGTKFSPETQREYFVSPKSSSSFDSTFNADIGTYKDALATNWDFDLTLGQTFFVVYAFENIGYSAYTSNQTSCTVWILDQADVTAIAGDFTRAKLNAHNRCLVTNNSGFEFGTRTLAASAPYQLFAQLGTAIFDEVRLGTTLADVAVAAGAPALTYSTWLTANSLPSDTLPGADYDGDGIANLLEYALNTSPVAAGPGTVASSTDLSGHLTLSFLRARAELSYVVQASSDLVTWSDLATNPGNVGETVTVTDTELTRPRRFLRLRVGL